MCWAPTVYLRPCQTHTKNSLLSNMVTQVISLVPNTIPGGSDFCPHFPDDKIKAKSKWQNRGFQTQVFMTANPRCFLYHLHPIPQPPGLTHSVPSPTAQHYNKVQPMQVQFHWTDIPWKPINSMWFPRAVGPAIIKAQSCPPKVTGSSGERWEPSFQQEVMQAGEEGKAKIKEKTSIYWVLIVY